MGICTSVNNKGTRHSNESRQSGPKEAPNMGTPNQKKESIKKYNPHSEIINLSDKTIIKHINEIVGDAIKIERCVNCTIIIMDHSAQVQIQECTNCKIFIAPCTGSVFIRNCREIDMISASGQFRCSSVEDGRFSIYASSSPAMERTKNVQLSCFCFGYVELPEMFHRAHLNIWQNCWSDYINFGEKDDVKFFEVSDEFFSPFKLALKDQEISIDQYYAVPLTFGKSYDYSNKNNMLLFFSDSHVDTLELLKFFSINLLNSYYTTLVSTHVVTQSELILIEQCLKDKTDISYKVNYLRRQLETNEELGQRKETFSKNESFRLSKGEFLVVWLSNEVDEFELLMEFIDSNFEQSCTYITQKDYVGTKNKIEDHIKRIFCGYNF